MFRFALFNLLSRKARTSLALLGLTVAIVGMVGLFSVVEGLNKVTEQAFSRIPGIMVLQTGSPIPLFSRLPAEWEDDLRQVEGVRVVSPEVWVRINVIDGKMIFSPPRFLFGVDIPTWNKLNAAMYRDDLVEGRFLTLDDRGTGNIVISKSIQNEFKLELNDKFPLNGREVTVVGVYETGSLLIDVTVLMDIGAVREMARFEESAVSAYYVEAEGDNNEDVIARIKTAFRGKKGDAWRPASTMTPADGNPLEEALSRFSGWLNQQGAKKPTTNNEPAELPQAKPPEQTPREGRPEIAKRLQVDESLPIDVQTSEAWGDKFQDLTRDLDFIMLILTSIGVTIAVLGIANTMLMSVSERIIEIGILKANGWSKKNVLSLIAFESGLLGLAGGCLGAFLGWLVTLAINANFPDRVSLYASPGLLLFSVVFSLGVGLLAGLYPAIWAMRLMPMDAIRRG